MYFYKLVVFHAGTVNINIIKIYYLCINLMTMVTFAHQT